MTAIKCPTCKSKHIIGIEVRGVYDGVLYWICGDCDHAFPRDWTGYGSRQRRCDEYVAAHNTRTDVTA